MVATLPPATRVQLDQLPNFFILGPAKTGSTSLHAYLAQHPQIFMTLNKEPSFFTTSRYDFGLDYYLRHFVDAGDFPVRGESTVRYYTLPEMVIPRLRALYGDTPLRFVVCVRDPVARAWSHYLHNVAKDQEDRSFEEALALEEARLQAAPTDWYGYVTDGLYGRRLRRWLQDYPLEAFHFVLTDDLDKRRAQAVGGVLRFLEVDEDVPLKLDFAVNQAGPGKNAVLRTLQQPPKFLKRLAKLLVPDLRYRRRLRELIILKARGHYREEDRPRMKPETAAQLRAQFAPDLADFAALTGLSLPKWGD